MRAMTDPSESEEVPLWFTDLQQLQTEVGEWATANFGDADEIQFSINERHDEGDPGADIGAMFTAMGAAEEVGELIHSVLKRAQGIRCGESGVGAQAEKDAVGDIIIYLADFCYRRGYDLDECVRDAWEGEVSAREWDSATRSQEAER